MKDKLHCGAVIRIYGEGKAFGPGVAQLLRHVEKTGSLQGAAAAMEMSYSKAWKILKEAERQWGFSLTRGETGGRDGGGSALTDKARDVLERYEAFREESRALLDELFEKHFPEEWRDSLERGDRT